MVKLHLIHTSFTFKDIQNTSDQNPHHARYDDTSLVNLWLCCVHFRYARHDITVGHHMARRGTGMLGRIDVKSSALDYDCTRPTDMIATKVISATWSMPHQITSCNITTNGQLSTSKAK